MVCGDVLLLWVLQGTARVLHAPPLVTDSPPPVMTVIVFLLVVFIFLFLLFITVNLGNAQMFIRLICWQWLLDQPSFLFKCVL